LQQWLDLAAQMLAGDEARRPTEPRVTQRGGCLIVPGLAPREEQDVR
jgi:hypothetical protein